MHSRYNYSGQQFRSKCVTYSKLLKTLSIHFKFMHCTICVRQSVSQSVDQSFASIVLKNLLFRLVFTAMKGDRLVPGKQDLIDDDDADVGADSQSDSVADVDAAATVR